MFVAKLNEVLASKRSIFSDRTSLVGFGLSGLLNIIHWLVLYFKIRPGKTQILVHYNVAYSANFVDKSTYLYLIPLLALVSLIINIFLAAYFYKKEKLPSQFLALASIPLQVLFLVASVILIVAND